MRRAALVLLASLGTLALAGCVPSAPTIIPTPVHSTAAPPFATEEDALAAATMTISEFYRVATTVLVEGGVGGDRLSEFATSAVVEHEKTGFDKLRDEQLVYRGETAIRSVVLQSYIPEAVDGVGVITAYVCTDGAAVTIFYPSGESYVSADRPNGVPFEIRFDLTTTNDTSLLVSSKLYWDGDGIC